MPAREIVVSVSCLTYNHAPFIRQCLDGFMMQKTDFAFEVLIHDDASTDGTTEIIKEYEARYPDVIKPIYEEENQWVKGRRGSAVFNFPRARGKYIALCVGDDYWTDPLKLQKQVDFLEKNLDFSFCCHRFQEIGSGVNDWASKTSEVISLGKFLNGECSILTLTIMFRYSSLKASNYFQYKIHRDILLYYALLSQGKCFYMHDTMGVYRKHAGGVWSLCDSKKKWQMSFSNVLEILNVENDQRAALYMYIYLSQSTGRKMLLSHLSSITRAIVKIYRLLGLSYALNVFCALFFRITPKLSTNA